MKSHEAAAVEKAEKSFIESVADSFSEVPFDALHTIRKFVGVIKFAGQKPFALFIKSHQPVAYDELVLD